MKEYIILFFLILGTLFILTAAIGLLKMPDVFLRMSASTIAATFGVASMLIAVAIHFGSVRITIHVTGIIVFLILTVPVGAHMMARASHIIGLPMWHKTNRNDLKGKYKPDCHGFRSLSEDKKKEDDKEANQNQNTI
ncbi:MAG: monovalent cation/H(+) antiporter subunit G [Bacteroidota bacterium]